MRRPDAAHLLGVATDATPDQVKAAFRAQARRRHPDAAGPDDGRRGQVMADLLEARRLLLAPPERTAEATRPNTPPPPEPAARVPLDGRIDGDSFLVDTDPTTLMTRLVEAAEAIGKITYLDRSSGLVEIMVYVQEEGDRAPAACSMVASLQGRLDGIEVFCTVERLDGHPNPPIAPLVEILASEVGVRP